MTVSLLSFISGLLYEEDSLGVFLLVTVVLGGGAAALAGRAVALTWRPWWQVVVYMLMLGAAVRFIHFALFEGTSSRSIIMRSTPWYAWLSALPDFRPRAPAG